MHQECERTRNMEDERISKAPAPEAPVKRRAALELAFGVGPTLVAGVVFGWFAGGALDRHFGTSPIWMSVLVLCGAAAGLLQAYRVARRLE